MNVSEISHIAASPFYVAISRRLHIETKNTYFVNSVQQALITACLVKEVRDPFKSWYRESLIVGLAHLAMISANAIALTYGTLIEAAAFKSLGLLTLTLAVSYRTLNRYALISSLCGILGYLLVAQKDSSWVSIPFGSSTLKSIALAICAAGAQFVFFKINKSFATLPHARSICAQYSALSSLSSFIIASYMGLPKLMTIDVIALVGSGLLGYLVSRTGHTCLRDRTLIFIQVMNYLKSSLYAVLGYWYSNEPISVSNYAGLMLCTFAYLLFEPYGKSRPEVRDDKKAE